MEANWRKAAWDTLAGTELRHGNYEFAARDFALELAEPSAQFTAEERSDAEQSLAMARALRETPPQNRIDHSGTSTITATWRTRGLEHGGFVYMDFRVNGLTEEALFETGAPCSIASESFARRHNLHMLPDKIDLPVSTGKTIPARLGLADEVRIGSMSFEHVVFVVCNDADVTLPPYDLKIDAAVGLPLILALEHVRVDPDSNSISIGLPTDSAPPVPPQERNLAFDGSTPLVRTHYRASDLPFTLDTGANETVLYGSFGQRFPEVLLGSDKQEHRLDGPGSYMVVPAQSIPQLELGIGGRTVLLHNTPVEDGPAYRTPSFGTVGGDLMAGGYELDFHRMHFSLLAGNQSSSAVPMPP